MRFILILVALTQIIIFNCLFSLAETNNSDRAIKIKSEEDKRNQRYTNYWIIYDSVCPYCKSAAKYIKELDWERKFKFKSYRDPETYKMFPFLTKEECEKDVHMVTPQGEVLVGYQVFRTIIDNLTATKLLNPLLKNNFAESKLNEIYEKMVKARTCYYNKSSTCKLKKGEAAKENP